MDAHGNIYLIITNFPPTHTIFFYHTQNVSSSFKWKIFIHSNFCVFCIIIFSVSVSLPSNIDAVKRKTRLLMLSKINFSLRVSKVNFRPHFYPHEW